MMNTCVHITRVTHFCRNICALHILMIMYVSIVRYHRPGPAHLDTCEFYISSRTDADFLLKYVGFIDRGQRIESRLGYLPWQLPLGIISDSSTFPFTGFPNHLFA